MAIPLVKQAQNRIQKYLHEGDIAVDATMGNGFDTLFLACGVSNNGKVYGFDVQKEALKATSMQLKKAGFSANVRLIHDSHEYIANYLGQDKVTGIRCAMFNLGYLPGSNKNCQTKSKATIIALESVLNYLQSPGIITLVAYTGHEGGLEEATAVKAWVNGLNKSDYKVTIEIPKVIKNSPPELIIIEAV